jgi:peptide/nickel transport system ATP-binding protein
MNDRAGALLDVSNLRVTYEVRGRRAPAVDGISLSLQPGESLGLAGESGCGKTTVALACLGLLPRNAAAEGSVKFKGEEIIGAKPGRVRAIRWAGISIIFQGAMNALNPVKRVGDQIAEAILLHSKSSFPAARKEAAELLAQVGIPKRRATDYPHEFSGGMRQRAMVAMALACRPPVVLADEPTTALDVMIQAQIIDLIASLRADLLRAPLHPYSHALVGAFPTVGDPESRGVPAGLAGDPPDPAERPPGCAFHPRCPLRFEPCDHIDPRLIRYPDARAAACHHVEARR